MEGKIILNLVMSLDGYIAEADGGFGWISGQGDNPADSGEPYDFQGFLDGIDVVVMGRNSYEQGFARDFPTKKVYVATNHPKGNEDNILFCSDIVEKIKAERNRGKRVYLFGGGVLVDSFVKANLIDEYIIGIVPTILGGGRPLFPGNFPRLDLHLDQYAARDGIIVLHYSRRAAITAESE